jgi:hypothetical protein
MSQGGALRYGFSSILFLPTPPRSHPHPAEEAPDMKGREEGREKTGKERKLFNNPLSHVGDSEESPS